VRRSADDPIDVLSELVRVQRAGRRAVLATVVAVSGSTPREPGARMLVLDDGTIGTIGGGQREADVIEHARGMLSAAGSRLVDLDFEEGLSGGEGPICGGRMQVLLESFAAPARVIVAGAGHVGQALHRILAIVGLTSVVIDPRPEFASSERFPGAELRHAPFERAFDGLTLGERDAVVILTPEHSHDETVLRLALDSAAGYVGMIGSRRKVEVIRRRLRDDGYPDQQIARVHAPIGLDIGAETPAEIGLAIAAEIVSIQRGGKAVR
jgi:xanthine dehydrogenase accessory factor